MTNQKSQIALIFVTIMLAAVNILLGLQNYQLRTSLNNSKQFVTEEGYRFTKLKIRHGNGIENIDLADGRLKTVLLVFNTGCQYCYQQYPYWKTLTRDLDPHVWRVIAVSSEGDYETVKAHFEQNGIDNLKVGLIDMKEMHRHRLLFTPMTLVLDSNGTVKKVWTGLRTGEFGL